MPQWHNPWVNLVHTSRWLTRFGIKTPVNRIFLMDVFNLSYNFFINIRSIDSRGTW